MRVWDIHPGYLSGRSLLGEHSEIHALYRIITGQKAGFARHPETKRWTGHLDLLVLRHDLLKHNSPLVYHKNINENDRLNHLSYVDLPSEQFEILRKKYLEKDQEGRIPLPRNGTEFWSHHKYSVMARGYQYYKNIQGFMKNRQNLPIQQEGDLILKIQDYIKLEVPMKALENTIQHLWGYFKEKVNQEEKIYFFSVLDSRSKLNILFTLAKKYQQNYLLHSTIFADLLPG